MTDRQADRQSLFGKKKRKKLSCLKCNTFQCFCFNFMAKRQQQQKHMNIKSISDQAKAEPSLTFHISE